MKTDFLIIGKGDDIITMILDNLHSQKKTGDITIFNNLGLSVISKIAHPSFNLFLESNVNPKDYMNWILGVYKPEIKKSIVDKLNLYEGNKFINCIHSSFDCSLTSTFGIGTLVNSSVTMAAHSILGNFVSINRGVTIGHHTTIGDFTSINPGCNIAGHCQIGTSTTIGMGSQVLNGVKIGDNTIIGAGSVVTKDIPSGVVAWGSPCKIIRENK
jgi:sugar O-acyltransferase (sialic acid O-acetyltransferase NeuD family)